VHQGIKEIAYDNDVTPRLPDHPQNQMEPIRISYFSDVLCVWAYIAQIRLDELTTNFQDKISIDWVIQASRVAMLLRPPNARTNSRAIAAESPERAA